MRAVASTGMNAVSSRSHAVFVLYVCVGAAAQDTPGGRNLHAKLSLVDLAGSERATRTGASGQQLKEAAAINKFSQFRAPANPQLAEHLPPVHVPSFRAPITGIVFAGYPYQVKSHTTRPAVRGHPPQPASS